MIEVPTLLASYPRKRPPLTAAHEKIYVEEYKANRDGKRLLNRIVAGLEGWCHERVARLDHSGPVLELGCGTLNHLPYETENRSYDVVEPFTELIEHGEGREKIRHVYDDITEIAQGSNYHRIISILVLEHVVDLPLNIAFSGLLLERDGVFQAAIPSEGGFLWWLAWRSTTGLAYRLRTGLDYGVFMRHEHVNTSPEIIALCQYFFQFVTVSRFPSPFHHLSFYCCVEARNPNRDICENYLQSRGVDWRGI